MRLVEGLVVSNESAVVGSKPELVLAVLVALLLRLVCLVLEAVVLLHLLSDSGPHVLELVGEDEEQLVTALLDVLDRLVEVRDLALELRDLLAERRDFLGDVLDRPRTRSKRVHLGGLLPPSDLGVEVVDLVLVKVEPSNDPLLLRLDGGLLCGKLVKLGPHRGDLLLSSSHGGVSCLQELWFNIH